MDPPLRLYGKGRCIRLQGLMFRIWQQKRWEYKRVTKLEFPDILIFEPPDKYCPVDNEMGICADSGNGSANLPIADKGSVPICAGAQHSSGARRLPPGRLP